MITIGVNQATRALYGAWRLARMDPSGMAFFDTSVDGFRRSFWAVGIVAPFYVVFLLLSQNAGLDQAGAVRYWAVESLSYVIGWTAFPVVMLTVSKSLDRAANFLRYIVAYNWAAVLQYAVFLPIAILVPAGFMAGDTANALMLVIFVPIIVYVWFVTKTALGVPDGTAAAIVGLDFLITLIIDAASQNMLPD